MALWGLVSCIRAVHIHRLGMVLNSLTLLIASNEGGTDTAVFFAAMLIPVGLGSAFLKVGVLLITKAYCSMTACG